MYKRKRPLNRAVRFLDEVIPPKLEALGFNVKPVREVAPEVQSLIASAKKAKEARKAKKAQKKRAKKAK